MLKHRKMKNRKMKKKIKPVPLLMVAMLFSATIIFARSDFECHLKFDYKKTS